MMVPDVDRVEFAVRAGPHKANVPVTLPAAKKWRVFIVPTAHTDVGYTDLQDRVKVRHANNGMTILQWLDQYPKFKWYSETYWQLNALLDLHPEKSDEIFDHLRQKRQGLVRRLRQHAHRTLFVRGAQPSHTGFAEPGQSRRV